METRYLGIDIGGTQIKLVVLDESGEILDQQEYATNDSAVSLTGWKSKIIELIAEKTKEFAAEDHSKLGCGISAPGLVDVSNRKILHMPERLQGIEGLDWSVELNREIVVVNDGHAACLAEYESFYKNQKIKNMLMLTLGTGVGGGVIINGEFYQGAMQRAGHFGHMAIDHLGAKTMTNMVGSLEYAVGNFSVKERTDGKFDSVKDLVGGYAAGDSLASYWWLSSIQKLAVALASLINAYSPELIVLGGGISSGAGEMLMKPLREFMTLYEWSPGGEHVPIKEANYKGFAGAIGAAFLARRRKKGD
ncbi:ROK family protein [Algoriphagus antarcticus]|uniref:Glucokinase n=1 Tax=Algoriphagus antarcticus TaxID=238540 RepID=A0A3E0DW30_9BACT|nr:ROK family protein [Algoriphagus antarcticus]REG90292.1 glucokinase [Algoriphagus antarcticus]